MRRTRFFLTAATALVSIMVTQAIAQERSDGASNVTQLRMPSYNADTSLGLVTGDNLGNHIATTDLNMDGLQIFNIGNPTGSMDAVNLQTLQDYVAANGDNLGNHDATQSLDMNGFQIIGLGAPTSNSMAANKSYVDSRADAARDNLGNHTATQNVDMSSHRLTNLANPSALDDAVNLDTLKTYVAANGDNLGDHVATQTLDLDGNSLVNMADPSAPGDAANKKYVDDTVAAVTTYIDGVSSVTITGGTGLTGGGDLTQNRVISFDTAWGDGRYALRSRLVASGTGLLGGGNLGANRTLSFDTTWGDGRYVNQSGDEAVSGVKTFNSAPRSVAGPVLAEDLANKAYVDAAASAAIGTLYSAGPGLTLDASNTFGLDGSVFYDRGALGNVSLDTVKESGVYNMTFANRGYYTAANHVPVPGATGVLEVSTTMMGDGQERIVQRFNGRPTSSDGDLYVRTYNPNWTYSSHTFYTGTTHWSPWLLVGGAVSGDGVSSVGGYSDMGTFQRKDSVVSVDNTVLRTSGDQSVAGVKTITGTLRVNTAPSALTDATNKAYVDAAIAASAGVPYTAGSGLSLTGTAFAVDGTVVRTSGAQTINDTKTFTGRVNGATFNATSLTDGGFLGVETDTQANPSFTWAGDLDTGMYHAGANQIGFSTGGTTPLSMRASAVFLNQTAIARDGLEIRNTGNRVLTFTDGGADTEGFIYHNDSDSSLRTVLRSSSNPAITAAEMRMYQNGDIAAMGGSRFVGDGSGLTNLNMPEKRAGDSGDGYVRYQGTTTSDPGFFNGSTSTTGRPTDATYRLNYNGQFWASTMYSTAYYYHSDGRLKTDVETIGGSEGMDIVNRIRPVNYAWIHDGKTAHGVIAQEVEKVYPEIVSTNSDGYKSVDYIQMIAPMLAAIQELDKRVEALEAAR